MHSVASSSSMASPQNMTKFRSTPTYFEKNSSSSKEDLYAHGMGSLSFFLPFLFSVNSIPRCPKQKINDLHFSSAWKQEGIEVPSPECKELGICISEKIMSDYQKIPAMISPSKEGGLFLTYTHPNKETRQLFIEIYNDLSVVALVNDTKKIVRAVDIEDQDFSEILSIFNKLS